jgi:hypothetical protein
VKPEVELSRNLDRGNSIEEPRLTDKQIIAVLKQAEAGTPVPSCAANMAQLCYKWRSKYGELQHLG